MRYEVAPLTLPQLKVRVPLLLKLPSKGKVRTGGEGADRMVKLQLADHELLPHELEDSTRQ
jgi:hypothetical protein